MDGGARAAIDACCCDPLLRPIDAMARLVPTAPPSPAGVTLPPDLLRIRITPPRLFAGRLASRHLPATILRI
jgi:hypothetical protein